LSAVVDADGLLPSMWLIQALFALSLADDHQTLHRVSPSRTPAWCCRKERRRRGNPCDRGSGSHPSRAEADSYQGTAPRSQSVNSTATVGSRIAASEKSLPTLFGGVVSLLLIDQFAMSRTKASVHPPAAIPKISGPDT
jgi:hypothetical protein